MKRVNIGSTLANLLISAPLPNAKCFTKFLSLQPNQVKGDLKESMMIMSNV